MAAERQYLNRTYGDRNDFGNIPTAFIKAAGIDFAYRAIGKFTGTPLICLQHFTGNMDSWDPAVINALAEQRSVIVFDNAGLGRSGGNTPDSIEQMAMDAHAFLSAMGFNSVDLLGFSLGGMVAQALAAHHPQLVRKIVLVGTAPRGGQERLLASVEEALARTDAPDPRLPLFFADTPKSWAAGLAFLKRASARVIDRDPESGDMVRAQQAKAIITWCATPDPGNSILSAIGQPVLIVSGSHDRMLPEENAMIIFRNLKDAQLLFYPDAGYASLFQYPQRFVRHVTQFLLE